MTDTNRDVDPIDNASTQPRLFFDTNALLSLRDKAFEEFFIVSQRTLEEIESIKTSSSKDQEVKYQARKVAHLLDQHFGQYNVVPTTPDIYDIVENFDQNPNSSDAVITAAAYSISKELPIVFVTDDICCKFLAKNIYKLKTKGVNEIKLVTAEEEYIGYKEIQFSDEEMAYFYEHMNENKYACLTNQYLIVKNSTNEIVDVYRWEPDGFKKVCNRTVKSIMFGDKIRPKDIYQTCAIDSIFNNTLTAISGKAGSGKSLISLISIMSLIESGEYDRLIIMFNPTKAKGAADMGFYTGNAVEKAMQNSIGSILTTKFGDRYAVETLMQQDKIRLVSMADIRGMEVRDNEILYITECQNTSIDLLKLCLSRASSGCKIIIEGDYDSQVDSYLFDGASNGLKKIIDSLKGDELFGAVKLPNVWRSKIAALVDKIN